MKDKTLYSKEMSQTPTELCKFELEKANKAYDCIQTTVSKISTVKIYNPLSFTNNFSNSNVSGNLNKGNIHTSLRKFSINIIIR